MALHCPALTSGLHSGHEALDGLLGEEGRQQLAHPAVDFSILDS
jgi:hypothetical protein